MITTRFAPSPTGRLHLGHAFSAVAGYDKARGSGGRFLLRIEDLDQGRSRPEFVTAIEQDLRWLGLEWDAPVLIQSQRSAFYDETLEKLRAQDLVYPCYCTRSDIAAAVNAPHAPTQTYPGTCRGLPHNLSRPHSWRLDAAKALDWCGVPTWTETDGRAFSSAEIGDEVLARKDAPAAYHLACVVDDAASGVTMVVRGADLRASTPVQRLLQQLLGLPEPVYLQHPLVIHDDGRRLAKRDLAPTLAAMREAGVDGRELARELATGVVPGGFRLANP